MKYGEWLTEWLNNYIRISAKHRTIERYSEIINNHLIPSVGDIELQELTPIILQKYISELLKCGNKRTGAGLSSSAVNSIITVIQNSLHTAYNLRYINDMVGDKLKRPKAVERQIECFSVAEQKQIEQAVRAGGKPYMLGVLICLYTGLRIGELLALEWSDIDFSNGTLMVDKTCHYGVNLNGQFGRIVDTPKTETSIRLIPLPKQLIPLYWMYFTFKKAIEDATKDESKKVKTKKVKNKKAKKEKPKAPKAQKDKKKSKKGVDKS